MLYFHKIVAIAEAQKYTGAGAAKRGRRPRNIPKTGEVSTGILYCTTCLFDKLAHVVHEEDPVVVHQQVQVDPLPSAIYSHECHNMVNVQL